MKIEDRVIVCGCGIIKIHIQICGQKKKKKPAFEGENLDDAASANG